MTSSGLDVVNRTACNDEPREPLSIAMRTGRFLVTGAVGFGVDAGVLAVLLWATEFGAVWSRGISFPLALLVTWVMNRSWSFGDREKPQLAAEIAGYAATQLTGFIITSMVYLALISGGLSITLAPLPALAVGALSSAVVTFAIFNSGLYRRSGAYAAAPAP